MGLKPISTALSTVLSEDTVKTFALKSRCPPIKPQIGSFGAHKF